MILEILLGSLVIGLPVVNAATDIVVLKDEDISKIRARRNSETYGEQGRISVCIPTGKLGIDLAACENRNKEIKISIEQTQSLLSELEIKIKKMFDDVQVKWTAYDNSFEKILEKGRDFALFGLTNAIQLGNTIVWRVDSFDYENSWMYKFGNGWNTGLDTVINKNVDEKISSTYFTSSGIKIHNKYMAQFQGVIWKGLNHYIPYTWTKWSETVAEGVFKNYMGPVFEFKVLASSKTFNPFSSNYSKVLLNNGPEVSVGMYYDSDRNEMKKIWNNLQTSKSNLFSSIGDLNFNIQQFDSNFSYLKQNSDHIEDKIFLKDQERKLNELKKEFAVIISVI